MCIFSEERFSFVTVVGGEMSGELFVSGARHDIGGLFKPKEFTLSYLDEGIWHDIKFPNSAATDEWKEAWDIAKWKNSNPAFSRLV